SLEGKTNSDGLDLLGSRFGIQPHLDIRRLKSKSCKRIASMYGLTEPLTRKTTMAKNGHGYTRWSSRATISKRIPRSSPAKCLSALLRHSQIQFVFHFAISYPAGISTLPYQTAGGDEIQTYPLANHPKLEFLWKHVIPRAPQGGGTTCKNEEATTAKFKLPKPKGHTFGIVIVDSKEYESLSKVIHRQWPASLVSHPMFSAFISSLHLNFRIDRIHQHIKTEIRRVEARTGHHYFACHVTSLIAVMLGRLRISIDSTIKAHWSLAFEIIPRRVNDPLSRERLKRAINGVLEDHCLHHGVACVGEEGELRRHDYAEFNKDKRGKSTSNLTYKARIKSLFTKQLYNTGALFFSEHLTKQATKQNIPNIPNRKVLDNGKLAIEKACCASTASRKHFEVIVIKRAEYIDGGASNNNSSSIALDEARAMSSWTKPEVAAVISLGCGEKIKPGLLGGSPLAIGTLMALARRVTNMEKTHENTENVCQQAGTPYSRLNVKPLQRHSGLRKIKMGHYKKKSKKLLSGQRQIPSERTYHPSISTYSLRLGWAEQERQPR
ncbi:unnamed protein product, partial [Clonostachys rosea]